MSTIYSRYGKKFKDIRESKGYSVSYFEPVGVSRGTLSKFENGKTMMGFEKVDVMLQRMNVSLAEYELIINDFVEDYQEEFIYQIENADIRQDFEKLHELYEEAYSSEEFLLSCVAKSRFEQLSAKEIEKVISKLENIKEWGYFELSIFTLS